MDQHNQHSLIDDLRNAVCLSQAARMWFPKSRTGNWTHPSVLSRWSDRGVLDPNGNRVYLKTWRAGGQRVLTQASAEAFLAALNPGKSVSDVNNDDTARRGREAGEALEKLGC